MPPVIAAIAAIIPASFATALGTTSIALATGLSEPEGTVFVDGWPEQPEKTEG